MSDSRVQHSRYAAIFALGTMISRVLGLAREIVATVLIPTAAFDAFVVAFRLPNMLREIIGEGAVNAAFVPVFSERLEKKSKRDFQRLVAAAFGMMILVLLVLTLAGMLLLPQLLRGILVLDNFTDAPPVTPERLSYLTHLSLLTFPYLFLIGLAVFCAAPLYILHHYSTPSWTPALLNVALIGSCLLLRDAFPDPAYALIAGVWLGGIAQLVAQYIAMGRVAGVWVPGFNFRDPGLRTVFLLLIPVILGQAAGEVNRLIGTFFAAGLPTGTVRNLYLADRVVQLPLSIFGVATSIAILPTLAKSRARGATEEVRGVLIGGLRQSFFLTVPAMAGLIVLAHPIVQLMYEWGHVDAAATNMIATAVVLYALGLLSFAWLKVCVTGFYAAQNTRIPVLVASASMLFNILLNFVLVGPLGYRGLAIATTICFTLNAVFLYLLLWQRVGPLYDAQFVSALIRMTCAAVLMAAVAWVVQDRIEASLGDATLLPRLVATLSAITAGAITYAGLCRAMAVPELDAFARALSRRMRS